MKFTVIVPTLIEVNADTEFEAVRLADLTIAEQGYERDITQDWEVMNGEDRYMVAHADAYNEE